MGQTTQITNHLMDGRDGVLVWETAQSQDPPSATIKSALLLVVCCKESQAILAVFFN